MSVGRLLPHLALVFALSGFANAQFGSFGKSKPTAPDQAAALTQAKNFLAAVGENVSGTTFVNADAIGNSPAVTSADGNTIGIDFDRLEAVVPPSTPGAAGHPGLLVVLIYHELQHRDHGWGSCQTGTPNDLCCEHGITAATAQAHCAFITFIVDNGGGPIDALCRMYAHVMAKYNASVASGATSHCTGSGPPTSIPPCPACP